MPYCVLRRPDRDQLVYRVDEVAAVALRKLGVAHLVWKLLDLDNDARVVQTFTPTKGGVVSRPKRSHTISY